MSHRGRRQQSAQRRGVETGRERIDDVRVVHQLLLEHERGGGDALEVEPGVDLGAGEPRDQRLGAGHRRAACEWRERAVGAIRSRDRGGVARQRGHARLRRDRDRHRDARGLADHLDRPRGGRRAEDAERIVQADRRVAGVDEPASHVAEAVEAAPGHLVVDDDPFGLLPGGGDRRRAALEVADVVQRVVAAKDVDPRRSGRLDEGVDEVVGDLTVSDQRLPADHREKGRDRRRGADCAQPLEGILSEEAQRRLEGRAAEDVESGKTAVVEGLGDRQSVAEAQPADHERLLPMAERRLHQFEAGHAGPF